MAATQLSWWRWKLRKEGAEAAEVERLPNFVELVAPAAPAPSRIEVVLHGGAVVRVPVGFDEATMARLVRVLGGVAP